MMTANAIIEHKMRGAIIQPPLLIISNTMIPKVNSHCFISSRPLNGIVVASTTYEKKIDETINYLLLEQE